MIRKGVLLAAALVAGGLAIGCSSSADTSAPPAGAGTTSAKAGASPQVLEHGRGIYKANCAPCHGESGRGDGPAAGAFKPGPTNHADAGYMAKLTDEDIAKVIQMGGIIKGKPAMPSNPQIRDADLAAVVAFTRSLSGAQP